MTARSHALVAMTGAVAPLRPISLAEVLDEAALQVRVDRKYLVPVGAFITMTNRLSDRFAVLDIDGRRSFSYESVYFDSPDHRLYRQHVQRRRRRYKVRTRAYLDSGECTFEVKLKGGRSETVKSRMPYGLGDRGRLTPSRWSSCRNSCGPSTAWRPGSICERSWPRRIGGPRWSIRSTGPG